jgi:hypothetical protein
MECLFEEGTILDDPPVDGQVIHLHPPFFHEFLDMACAQRLRHIPPHPHENDLFGEMGPLNPTATLVEHALLSQRFTGT